MNEAEVRELKNKLIKADKTVHIQQLGMQWVGPVENATEQSNNDLTSKLQNSVSASLKKGGETAQTEEEFQFNIPPLEMEILTEILLRETDFLLDDKTKNELGKIEDPLEARRVRLETIKKTLALDSLEEVDELFKDLHKMVRVTRHDRILRNAGEEEEEGEEEGEEEDYEDVEEGEPEIDYDPDLLVGALIAFMKDTERRKKQLEEILAKRAIHKENEREKKERIAREGKAYWTKLTHVLPDHTIRIWRVLDKALSKYYSLLLERQKLIEETGDLHNQNEELKNLLNQYFQINHELIIPPTKMIQLEAQNSQ